ncbi:MAG: hypothetical protein LUD27_09135 [Clostridia bacterium]|nr:hypothetical protein [Clostridia bacterium]
MRNTDTEIIGKAEGIRADYVPRTEDDFDRLKKLDKKVKRPKQIFGITFGVASMLVLGVGMSICLGAIGASSLFPLGVAIGAAGVLMAIANVLICEAIDKSRKKKYAKEIIELSDKILNND